MCGSILSALETYKANKRYYKIYSYSNPASKKDGFIFLNVFLK